MRLASLGLCGCAATTLLALGLPRDASACGGTFCDAGPQAMPVDQTGENIVFVMDEARVEAHIQIQYDPDTDADQFAWLIPVTEVPTFSVGSDRLFENVLAATVPAYGFTTQFDSCEDTGTGTATADGGATGGSWTGSDGGGGDDGPDVVLEETVGAFDIVVLSGGTADEVMQWLADNGYQQDPNALPILEDYLAEGYLFAAFKLTNGADVAEIHPVVLEFQNQEACIPLRLTRIAAVENMEVRTFFLADDRVVPRNYRHVLVNPLKLDWLRQGDNYEELITLAVDTAAAEGRAFVTEYAGPSSVVSRAGLYNVSWNVDAIAAAEAVDVVDILESQGIMQCEPWGCEYYHLLIEGLLAQFLPVPAGVGPSEFYDCLTCYEALIDTDAWDAAAFAQAYDERIIAPGQHAWSLLTAFPYLSRMYTTISPAEMTQDPFFHPNPDLQDVDLRASFGNRFVQCDGDAVFTLPDGREVYIPAGQGWPDFDDEMPWAEDVERMLPGGPPESLEDNTARIDAKLREYNCQFDYPSVEACGGDDTGTGGGGTGGGETTGSDGGAGDDGGSGDGGGPNGTGTGDGTWDPGADDGSPTSGCACRATDGGALGITGLLGLLALATRGRRS